jgi:mRNA interferase MazF
LKRGDLVTVAGGGGYAGKPRPAVVVQSDDFRDTASVTISLLTGNDVEAPLIRLPVEPSPGTGLATRSWIMVDKLVTVRRDRVGRRFGRLSDTDVLRLNRALLVFLGLAGG